MCTAFIDLLNGLLEPVRVSLSPPYLCEASSQCLRCINTHPLASLPVSSLWFRLATEWHPLSCYCSAHGLQSQLGIRMLSSGSELSVFKESVCKLQLITARLPYECLFRARCRWGGPSRQVFNHEICSVHGWCTVHFVFSKSSQSLAM